MLEIFLNLLNSINIGIENKIRKALQMLLNSSAEVDFVSDYHASSEYRKRVVIELTYQLFLEALGNW